jgi:hypothetical protein
MLKKLSQYIDFGSREQSPRKGEEKATDGQRIKGDKFAEGFDFLSLIKAWKEIAGDKLSEHTIPLKNQNGTLLVLSNHSAFANELKFMELPLKKKIFERFPNLEKSIQSIKFIVDSTHFSKQYAQFVTPVLKNNKSNETLLHPYSPLFRKLKKEAEELFSDMEDAEMKERLISLYIQSGSHQNS